MVVLHLSPPDATKSGMQELTEARALAEAAQRKADKLIAVARKAAGEVHAARALADAEHAMAEAERSEKAEFKAAKERVSHTPLYMFSRLHISSPNPVFHHVWPA